VHFEKYSEVLEQDEYSKVSFYARLLSLKKLNNYYVVNFFDGYEKRAFKLFNPNSDIEDHLLTNKVYLFEGETRGDKGKYFKLNTYKEVPVVKKLDDLLFPERLNKPSDKAVMIYNTFITEIANKDLRKFVAYCLGLKGANLEETQRKKIYAVFAESPCSLANHDCYKGGLMVHIAGMLSAAKSLKESYESGIRVEDLSIVDWDLLYAIIYLHDVGKPLTYYKSEGSIGFEWKSTCLENHSLLGSHYIYHCWSTNKLISFALLQKILYCIDEHMNTVMQPKVKELTLLKALDSFDASLASIICRL